MASTIKVDNIQDQCGSAVVTKCGASKTLTVTTTKADNYQAADGGNIINQCGTTITLGASGDTISLACGASQTGFGRTGTVDWDTTAKTASFTAVSGNGYFVNTTSGAITVTLPAGSAGDIVGISDYASTFQTNSVTITPNGTDKINGTNANATLSTQGIAVSLVYVDDTRGWKSVTGSDNDTTGTVPFIVATGGTITTSGNCKIHTFTGPGTFTVCNIAEICAPTRNQVSYIVVAGGGGASSAGGGAGGFREDKSPVTPYTASPLEGAGPITVTATGFPITVGGGGPPGCQCHQGSNSVFSTITSAGGGGGKGNDHPTISGGSGGGGRGSFGGTTGPAGSGNTPPVSPPQGNPGGAGTGPDASNPLPDRRAGGGGGATVAGNSHSSTPSGKGGDGATTSISGSSTSYAGGGGANQGPAAPSPGGTGGGGAGGSSGTANTGGGAGGGASGGSGVVIIRYKFQ
jgi:hypothetical protein